MLKNLRIPANVTVLCADEGPDYVVRLHGTYIGSLEPKRVKWSYFSTRSGKNHSGFVSAQSALDALCTGLNIELSSDNTGDTSASTDVQSAVEPEIILNQVKPNKTKVSVGGTKIGTIKYKNLLFQAKSAFSGCCTNADGDLMLDAAVRSLVGYHRAWTIDPHSRSHDVGVITNIHEMSEGVQAGHSISLLKHSFYIYRSGNALVVAGYRNVCCYIVLCGVTFKVSYPDGDFSTAETLVDAVYQAVVRTFGVLLE